MEPTHEEESPKNISNNARRNKWLIGVSIFFVGAAIIFGIYWLAYGRFYIYTDDAYVYGNQLMLSPQVSSGVQAIFAEETDWVEKGQLIVRMDNSLFILALEEAKESLAKTVRQIAGYFSNAEALQADLLLKRAQLRQDELNLLHREDLVITGAVSLEEFETYQTQVIVGKAAVSAAEKNLATALALIEGVTVATHPDVMQKVTELKRAYLEVIYCDVLAPMSGYVAKRSVQVGDFIHSGQPMLQIIPLDYLWVEANYKETQLKRIRIGQPVAFTADMHGRSVKYQGDVIGFQPGSGSAFALLPPQNASGNWIKIVQRVPVRISIKPEEIKRDPLLLGVSLRVKVNTTDDSGSQLSYVAQQGPIYTTDIYQTQFVEMERIEQEIQKIISENSVGI